MSSYEFLGPHDSTSLWSEKIDEVYGVATRPGFEKSLAIGAMVLVDVIDLDAKQMILEFELSA